MGRGLTCCWVDAVSLAPQCPGTSHYLTGTLPHSAAVCGCVWVGGEGVCGVCVWVGRGVWCVCVCVCVWVGRGVPTYLSFGLYEDSSPPAWVLVVMVREECLQGGGCYVGVLTRYVRLRPTLHTLHASTLQPGMRLRPTLHTLHASTLQPGIYTHYIPPPCSQE